MCQWRSSTGAWWRSGPKPPLDFSSPQGRVAGSQARTGARTVYSARRGAFVDTAVYDRYALTPGMVFSGPAIVEERESTLVETARVYDRV